MCMMPYSARKTYWLSLYQQDGQGRCSRLEVHPSEQGLGSKLMASALEAQNVMWMLPIGVDM